MRAWVAGLRVCQPVCLSVRMCVFLHSLQMLFVRGVLAVPVLLLCATGGAHVQQRHARDFSVTPVCHV